MAARDPENPRLGGGEIVLYEFSKALAERGHSVDYLCATFSSAHRERWLDGVRIRRLASETLLGPATFLIYRKEYRGQIDLVLEDIIGGSRIPFFAPLYVQEPIVAMWFQDHIPLFKYQYPLVLLPLLKALERLIVKIHGETQILTISSQSKTSLIEKGADPDRVRVYYPGLSPEFLQSEHPARASLRERRIVCLGKLRRYKCAHHAILAFHRISERVPSARLSVVGRMGDRDYHRELIALTRDLGVEDRVDFEIGVTEGRKKELLRSSRALVAPAPVEGFGIALIEANACGVPVVGSEGIPEEALEDGTNGFRVPFGDITAIAERTLQLLTDDEVFDQLSSRAIRFSQQFTWRRATIPLLELVENLG